MSRVVVEVSDEHLAAAAQVLGTDSVESTVNGALADSAGREQRLAYLDTLDDTAPDLGDSAVMDDAWP